MKGVIHRMGREDSVSGRRIDERGIPLDHLKFLQFAVFYFHLFYAAIRSVHS